MRAFGLMPLSRDLQAMCPQGPEAQAYLLSNLLPLQFQHLLLLIGMIHDVSAPDEQLALHGLGTQRGLETGYLKRCRVPKLRFCFPDGASWPSTRIRFFLQPLGPQHKIPIVGRTIRQEKKRRSLREGRIPDLFAWDPDGRWFTKPGRVCGW